MTPFEHHTKVIEFDSGQIKASVIDSILYENYRGTITTKRTDCLSAAIECNKDNITILNFASFTSPGGGYMSGAWAQEESLCSESNLYEILNDKQFKEFYDYNKKHKNNGLYEDRAIFTPNVKFTRDNKDYFFNVLTCAAPNYKIAIKNGISSEEIRIVYKERLRFIYEILDIEHQDVFIAGAWGCGVFGNYKDYAIRCYNELATVDTILAIPCV